MARRHARRGHALTRRYGRAYGDKRDYPKIELYVGGKYVATTTWARTVNEAKAKYIEGHPGVDPSKVKAVRQVRS
jgi:hypothetical protein